MSLASVREYFQKRSMEHRILEFDVSSATVDLAALAVGVIPARIGKPFPLKTGGVPFDHRSGGCKGK